MSSIMVAAALRFAGTANTLIGELHKRAILETRCPTVTRALPYNQLLVSSKKVILYRVANGSVEPFSAHSPSEGLSIMYRDRVQWGEDSSQNFEDQTPIRQVVRETGISRKTIRKMLANRWPKQYGPRSPGNPKPLPRTASIGRTVGQTANPDKRAEARNIAFDWMRSVLQNQLALSASRNDLGELPELGELLRRLYEGRLTERNRSMVILASRRGLACGVTCSFLGIDRHTYRKYLRTFEHAGVSALFAPQTKSNRITCQIFRTFGSDGFFIE